jgi:acetyltransferase-like isoleucine patch superfamily enzyme
MPHSSWMRHSEGEGQMIKGMTKQGMRTFAVRMGALMQRFEKDIARATLPTFATKAKGLEIQLPRKISNPASIYLGDDVKLGPGSVLRASTEFPGGWMHHPNGEHVSQAFKSRIIIGDRVTATGALQVVAFDTITIEDDVMFATNIFICDGLHGYETAQVPYKYQGMTQIAPIAIKRGAWIGQNVVIMPGVTIGELAIVGANSVVTKDLPDRCIAVGAPAGVIKTWDDTAQAWIPVTKTPAKAGA